MSFTQSIVLKNCCYVGWRLLTMFTHSFPYIVSSSREPLILKVKIRLSHTFILMYINQWRLINIVDLWQQSLSSITCVRAPISIESECFLSSTQGQSFLWSIRYICLGFPPQKVEIADNKIAINTRNNRTNHWISSLIARWRKTTVFSFTTLSEYKINICSCLYTSNLSHDQIK